MEYFFEENAALLVFAFLIRLCVFLAAGKEFEQIAADKGYRNVKYFWWTFFVPIAGMLMVAALPDRGNGAVQKSDKQDQLPDL